MTFALRLTETELAPYPQNAALTNNMEKSWKPSSDKVYTFMNIVNFKSNTQMIEEIFHLYQYKSDRQEITDYFLEHPKLIEHIRNGYDKIREITDNKYPLGLHFYVDPEYGNKEIWLQIWTNLDAKSAIELKNNIYIVWLREIKENLEEFIGLEPKRL